MKTSKKAASKKNTDPVVHFEMPVENRPRMMHFYSTAFGWQMQQLGEEMNNYVLATTAANVDKKGRPKKTGIINGGFFTKSNDMPAQYPSVVIAVNNLKKSMNRILKSGGRVIGEPMEIPGYGMYVSFYDTEGNRVSLMAPSMKKKKKNKKNK